jgi:catechol 2,3-dioxygenase-like lactoylglutathione lyase family enzyme
VAGHCPTPAPGIIPTHPRERQAGISCHKRQARVVEAALSQVIDHMSLGVSDLERAQTFYDVVLAALGFSRLYNKPESATYGLGQGSDDFSVVRDRNGAQRSGAHIAFRARSPTAVDRFHAAALAAGGKDDGAPGFRPEYHGGYYAAFVIDPDGNRIEAVCHIRS